MILETSRFGKLEIDDAPVYFFPEGIPGFSEEKKFALLKLGLEDTPFSWLQSAQDGSLCFLAMDPSAAFADYIAALHDDAMETIRAEVPDQLQLLCIVTVPDGQMRLATANLKAPVVLNPRTRRGAQVIVDEAHYSMQQRIFSGEGA